MKIKFSLFICYLGLLISVETASCEVLKNKDPISAIDWLTEIHTSPRDKPQKKQDYPKEFSISAPKVALAKHKENRPPINLDQIYDGNIDVDSLRDLYKEVSFDLPPSILELFYKTLIVRSTKYLKNDQYDQVLFLRLQKLFEFGAIPQIMTLLDNIDLNNKFLFKIWLDTQILSYSDTEACTKILGKNLSIFDYKTRIYCLEQSGNKKAAILTLKAVESLNLLPLIDEINLHKFLYSLGDKRYQISSGLAPVDPINYRIHKDIGNSFLKQDLSLPYYFPEISNNTNNLQKIEYVEDLVKSGAMSYDQLHALYSSINLDSEQGKGRESYKRAALTQKLEYYKKNKYSKNLSNNFKELFEALKEINIDNIARKYYSFDLLNLVNDYPQSRKALKLLISSCDMSSLKKIKNISRLHPIYQNIIFDIPLKKTYQSIPVNIILNAIRAKTPPNKPQSIIDKNNQAEAMLIAIKMLNNRNIVEIENVEMSIKYFNSVRFYDIAREVALYTFANDIIEWK